MARKATMVKTTVSLDSENLEAIDEIAGSFEDFVSRGEVIDMAFEYILKDESRLEGAFGEDEGENDRDKTEGEGEEESDETQEAD